MTLKVGCTPSLKLRTSENFKANITVLTKSNINNVYKMAAPLSDRSWCPVTMTTVIETKLNSTLITDVAKLSRQCKTVECYDIDVFSTNEPCIIQFKIVSTFASFFNHTSDEITITISPNNLLLPNMKPFLAKPPLT